MRLLFVTCKEHTKCNPYIQALSKLMYNELAISCPNKESVFEPYDKCVIMVKMTPEDFTEEWLKQAVETEKDAIVVVKSETPCAEFMTRYLAGAYQVDFTRYTYDDGYSLAKMNYAINESGVDFTKNIMCMIEIDNGCTTAIAQYDGRFHATFVCDRLFSKEDIKENALEMAEWIISGNGLHPMCCVEFGEMRKIRNNVSFPEYIVTMQNHNANDFIKPPNKIPLPL